ncbi:alpha/beta hydrolase [Gorillibacterium massiliense]|uniref:alpha/beta hydrolase n=1 Tax=Gorillibacterium massiliense TaxID=1280390 RepID=UPI0004AEDFB9|nr:alpha/beta hydrolase [Gorillibacterium massiliense]
MAESILSIRINQLELAASLHEPDHIGNEPEALAPLVIICHGFVGSRIGVDRLFVKAGRELGENGFAVLRFDFAGCGESSGDYGDNGLDSMIAQTIGVIDYAEGLPGIDPERITLLGHSLGGAVAIHVAAVDRRIKNLILWSPVANPINDIVRIVGKAAYEEAIHAGSTDYAGYRLSAGFFNSLVSHHPFQEVRKFPGNVLLVHGTSDDVIPVDYSFLYQKVFRIRTSGHCEKEIINSADHTFSSQDGIRRLLDKTKQWLSYVNSPESYYI